MQANGEPYAGDIVHAFQGVCAMLLVLKNQQENIVALLATLEAKMEQWYLCEAGTGLLSENGLWVPLLQGPLDVDFPEWQIVTPYFVPGAAEHFVSGCRILSPVVQAQNVQDLPGMHMTQAQAHMLAVTETAGSLLGSLGDYFGVHGTAVTSLGSLLSVRRVRDFFCNKYVVPGATRSAVASHGWPMQRMPTATCRLPGFLRSMLP